MKYSNWAKVYENDPSADSYDKSAEAVGDITLDTLTVAECITNIKKEPSLMFLSIEPITNDIQILHHVTAIGGNIAQPDNVIAAFSGLNSNPLVVRLDPDIFVPKADFKVPAWTSIAAITDLTSVAAATANARNVMMYFRNIIAIPPLLTKTAITSTSKNPSQLIVEFITACKAFDTVHAADADFPDSLTACKRILYFLWGAANNKIPPTISIPQNDGIVQQYRLDLEEKHILSAAPIAPAAAGVTGPSDKTLGSLASNIQNLTTRLETDSQNKKADKDEKKDKFRKLPTSSQQTILFASSASSTVERKDPNPSFESLLLQSTLSRARTHLNQVLSSFGCQFDASSILVASIMAGDLIWSKTSHTPEKFTIFLMGRPSRTQSMSQKDWLKLHLQESNSNQLDDAIINKLSEFKFDYPKSLHDLRHFINNLVGMCRLLFYGDSIITKQVATWIEHIDENEILYEMQFEIDPLFGLKICLTVDRAVQLFLTSCQEQTSTSNINFRYLDFVFDQECIEKGRFTCNPPPSLLSLFDAATPRQPPLDGGGGKRPRRNALSGLNQDDKDGANNVKNPALQNTNRSKPWALTKDEDHTKVFPNKMWTEYPPPFLNGTTVRCCPRWLSRGYCFDNCKRSHGNPNHDTAEKYNTWLQQCRDIANKK